MAGRRRSLIRDLNRRRRSAACFLVDAAGIDRARVVLVRSADRGHPELDCVVPRCRRGTRGPVRETSWYAWLDRTSQRQRGGAVSIRLGRHTRSDRTTLLVLMKPHRKGPVSPISSTLLPFSRHSPGTRASFCGGTRQSHPRAGTLTVADGSQMGTLTLPLPICDWGHSHRPPKGDTNLGRFCLGYIGDTRRDDAGSFTGRSGAQGNRHPSRDTDSYH